MKICDALEYASLGRLLVQVNGTPMRLMTSPTTSVPIFPLGTTILESQKKSIFSFVTGSLKTAKTLPNDCVGNESTTKFVRVTCCAWYGNNATAVNATSSIFTGNGNGVSAPTTADTNLIC